MTNALTLSQAAERLAPVFVDDTSSIPVTANSSKGKWMSLENAAAVLSERVSGQHLTPKKKKAELTVDQAARHIELRPSATPVELAEIRARRLVASATKLQSLAEFQNFMSCAALPFEGVDEATALASPEFTLVYGHAHRLRDLYEGALRNEFDAWEKQCLAENSVFESGRPDWSLADTTAAVAMLSAFGVSEREILQLWWTPTPVDVTSPACLWLAQLVAGKDNPDPIRTALSAVGFDDGEIEAVLSGSMEIYLRDHRIQELIARAADAITPTENRAAA